MDVIPRDESARQLFSLKLFGRLFGLERPENRRSNLNNGSFSGVIEGTDGSSYRVDFCTSGLTNIGLIARQNITLHLSVRIMNYVLENIPFLARVVTA